MTMEKRDFQIANCRFQIADCRLQIADSEISNMGNFAI